MGSIQHACNVGLTYVAFASQRLANQDAPMAQ